MSLSRVCGALVRSVRFAAQSEPLVQRAAIHLSATRRGEERDDEGAGHGRRRRPGFNTARRGEVDNSAWNEPTVGHNHEPEVEPEELDWGEEMAVADDGAPDASSRSAMPCGPRSWRLRGG